MGGDEEQIVTAGIHGPYFIFIEVRISSNTLAWLEGVSQDPIGSIKWRIVTMISLDKSRSCTQIARRHVILDMLSCNAAQQQHLIPNSFWWIRVVVQVWKRVASLI